MRERVSDSVRNRAVERLQRAYACGTLERETFEHRLDAALTTDSPSELRQLTSDLAPRSLFDTVRGWIPRRPGISSSGLLAGLAGSRPAILGRSRACDLVLSDDSVSRRHAMLFREGDRIILTDLGSTNGTLLNGRWVTEAEVQPGDRLRLGELDLVL